MSPPPEGMRIDVFELDPIPLCNTDRDETLGGGPYPEAVAELRARVASSGPVLMTVPEYNWGPAGVLERRGQGLPARRGVPAHGQPDRPGRRVARPGGRDARSPGSGQNQLSTNGCVLQQPVVRVGGGAARFDELLDRAARVGAPVPVDTPIRLG